MNELDQLLANARAPEMPGGLSARMYADADLVQAGFQATEVKAKSNVPPGIWAQLLHLLGGWPTLGGLVTAGAVGVWIGFAPPSFLPDPVQLVMGQGLELDLMGMGALADAVSEDG
ncbi:MAG: hypothetical protein L3J36_01725 [Rhodobacteraceae bacterium]|nr:hypothetical protein [Paracoccaceae bacterium]